MKPWKSYTVTFTNTLSSGFNGATAMKPWKSIPSIESKTVIAKLQWGHGDEAVEDD